jgi:hypothetical protein
VGIRKKIYKKGWNEKDQQDIIINIVSARSEIHEFDRTYNKTAPNKGS